MQYTYREILTQTEAWQQALEKVQAQASSLQALWQDRPFRGVLFVGCGSTYYLARAAAAFFRAHVGHMALALPGGEVMLYPDSAYPNRVPGPTLLVAISRSGTTTETVRAVEAFLRADRGTVLAFTNHPESPLAQLAHAVVSIEAGQEQSVVQTRSFASMYVATTAWTLTLAGKSDLLQAMAHLPAAGQDLLARYEETMRSLAGQAWSLVFVLGSDFRHGLAQEIALKLQETSLTPALAYPFLDFRHGPKSLVEPGVLVVGMLSPSQQGWERPVLHEAASMGAHTLALGPAGADVVFPQAVPEPLQGVLYLPLLQLLAYYRALAKGLNPDRPRNLTAVVRLEGDG